MKGMLHRADVSRGELREGRRDFDRANQVLGYDLASICFNGPEAELTRTENAQPAIYLVSWIALQLLKEQALRADWVLELNIFSIQKL